MPKKYRNQTGEELLIFYFQIMIIKNLIPSIWEKDQRGLELLICSSHNRYFNY